MEILYPLTSVYIRLHSKRANGSYSRRECDYAYLDACESLLFFYGICIKLLDVKVFEIV